MAWIGTRTLFISAVAKARLKIWRSSFHRNAEYKDYSNYLHSFYVFPDDNRNEEFLAEGIMAMRAAGFSLSEVKAAIGDARRSDYVDVLSAVYRRTWFLPNNFTPTLQRTILVALAAGIPRSEVPVVSILCVLMLDEEKSRLSLMTDSLRSLHSALGFYSLNQILDLIAVGCNDKELSSFVTVEIDIEMAMSILGMHSVPEYAEVFSQ